MKNRRSQSQRASMPDARNSRTYFVSLVLPQRPKASETSLCCPIGPPDAAASCRTCRRCWDWRPDLQRLTRCVIVTLLRSPTRHAHCTLLTEQKLHNCEAIDTCSCQKQSLVVWRDSAVDTQLSLSSKETFVDPTKRNIFKTTGTENEK